MVTFDELYFMYRNISCGLYVVTKQTTYVSMFSLSSHAHFQKHALNPKFQTFWVPVWQIYEKQLDTINKDDLILSFTFLCQ